MKNLVIVFIFSLFSNFSFSQVNVGFAKAANLDEGKSFSSTNEAFDRFIDGLQSPLLGQIYLLRINQCFKNAGMQYGGRDQITITEAIKILQWVKSHPEDMSKYGIGVYQLSAGTYTFQTISYKDGKWVDGMQIQRQAHEGEYVLEWWSQKVGSSWCLNLFPSVGEVQNKPVPAPTYEPTEPEYDDTSLSDVAESGNTTVNINNYYGTENVTEEEEEEFPLYPVPRLTKKHHKTVHWQCAYCGQVMHKNALQRHVRDHQEELEFSTSYHGVASCNNGLSVGEAVLISLLTPTPRIYGYNRYGGYSRNHRHNRNCRH